VQRARRTATSRGAPREETPLRSRRSGRARSPQRRSSNGGLELRLRGELAELARLEQILDGDWSNVSAVAIAVARARAAADPLLPTAAGQRVRLVLNMLGEANAKRASAVVNARGGTS
jgi:hypothetical protein